MDERRSECVQAADQFEISSYLVFSGIFLITGDKISAGRDAALARVFCK